MQTKIQKLSIHQFSPSCGKGDGVSKGMLFTRSLLRELGFHSEIYSELIQDGLESEVRPLSQLNLEAQDLLLVHFSLGYLNCAWLNEVKAAKLMVYHNITPPEFLPNNELPSLSRLGRQQLTMWNRDYVGA
ncbi:MAG: hypothetical protein K2P84_14520, partial [Undibacterium sp.]|nr:hypothetical protein [Undibacterium sp.]